MSLELEDTGLESSQSVVWDRVPDHLKCIPTINNYCKALPGAAHPEISPRFVLLGANSL